MKTEAIKHMVEQDNIFATSEGDAWFRRNRAGLTANRSDPLLELIQLLPQGRREGIRSVCDVGCSNADRLSRFSVALPNCSRVAGFDASAEATADGTAAHPDFELHHGLADDPPLSGPFDMVIVNFVLHWVDRRRLSRAVAAIDGLVGEGGFLLISDFLPDRPCARRYHHREDVALYTYKQDYPAVFGALGLYRELARTVFAHEAPGGGLAPSHDQNRACAAILQKTCEYPVVEA